MNTIFIKKPVIGISVYPAICQYSFATDVAYLLWCIFCQIKNNHEKNYHCT